MAQSMSTIFRFEGLMVFHCYQSNEIFDVGVLDASEENLKRIGSKMPPHIFSIKDLLGGSEGKSAQQLNEYKSQSNLWYLDVENVNTHIPRIEIHGNTSSPEHRRDANGELLDLGWLINLPDEFHPNENLQMKSGMLHPIIRLRNGQLYTSCKTDGIKYSKTDEEYDFGYIAEAIALSIQSTDTERIVLRTDNGVEILNLPYRREGYRISLENVVPALKQDEIGDTRHRYRMPDEDQTQHFQLYYDLLYPTVAQRCYLKLYDPPEKSPNFCSESEIVPDTIPPYKCGGILVDQDLS